jgi:hypothetical protein
VTDSGLQKLLKQGEELFQSLEQETAACLKTIETISAEDLELFLGRRQKLVANLREFDTKLSAHLSDSLHPVSLSDMSARNDFKQHYTRVLQKIMSMDGLLKALAERKMILLSKEIDSLSRGLKALHGYQTGKDNVSLRDIVA